MRLEIDLSGKNLGSFPDEDIQKSSMNDLGCPARRPMPCLVTDFSSDGMDVLFQRFQDIRCRPDIGSARIDIVAGFVLAGGEIRHHHVCAGLEGLETAVGVECRQSRRCRREGRPNTTVCDRQERLPGPGRGIADPRTSLVGLKGYVTNIPATVMPADERHRQLPRPMARRSVVPDE